MPWSIIIGNGVAIDAATHCCIEKSPSYPWDWEVRNPYDQEQGLLEVFPRLKKHLTQLGMLSELSVDEAMQEIVTSSQHSPMYKPHEKASESDYVHMEACHYLRMAYAWFSEQLPVQCLENWKWTIWLQHQAPNIETVMSYNYDTIFESSMRLAHLGKVYSSTRQNKLFGPGLILLEPEIYWDEKEGDVKVVHIAKPHGSCNFSGLGIRETRINGKKKDLYPIEDMLLLRDSTLKILDGNELFKPTHTADLVMPGEWGCWGGSESTKVAWATQQKGNFIYESQHADKLLVAGFSCSEPDRLEFESIVNSLPNFNKVYVVNPTPTKVLLDILSKISKESIELVDGPPS